MRNRKRCFLGLLFACIFASTTVIPAMATENTENSSVKLSEEIAETDDEEWGSLSENDLEEEQENVSEEETEDVVQPDEESDVPETELLAEETIETDDETEDDLLEAEEEEDIDTDNEIAVLDVVQEEDTSNYNGFHQDPESGDWYYYVKGKIATDRNDVIKDTDKQIDNTVGWWYVVGGMVQMKYTGVADYKNANGWWYIKNGKVDFSYNGFATNSNGSWYVENGKVMFDENSVIKDTAGAIGSKGTWYYVVGSKVQYDYTGVADYKNANGWWYIKNGKVDFTANTVAKNKNGWWYVDGGKVDFSYNGFSTNSNGSWYIENGKVMFSKNGVIKDTTGAIGSKGTWYYVVGSEVQTSYTGVANYKNENGWWYIKNGAVDFSANTVAKNKNGWWYVTGGKVDFSYDGFGTNSNGSWYLEDGKVKFNKNSVIKDIAGAIGTKNIWYYVVGSKVQADYTGVADYKNSNGWWYISDGKVDFSYDGFANNKNGSWYVDDGKVTFNKNSVLKDTSGAIGAAGTWYYVVGSQVQSDFTGLANYRNSNGWWYIKNGEVDFTANGVYKNNNGWWYVDGGKVQFDFNGIAKNSNGWWYINGGKVDFSYNGRVTVEAGTYTVVDGKVQNVDLTGVISSPLQTTDDESSYEYEVPEDYIDYGGQSTTVGNLVAPQYTGSVNSNGNMTLTWNSVSGAAKYRVFRREYNGGWGSWTKMTDTTSTTYTDSNLWTDSKLYQYTVRCLDSDGNFASPYISSYSGSAIAEYAQLFVGRPYVYGGISLTNGCDCSGFIMQVYAHFGYFLPHYSGAQITLGKEVSYANAQPGDIIGRAGHTMLYIGNGKVVHAQDSKSGIVISNVSSTNYTNIRRIL